MSESTSAEGERTALLQSSTSSSLSTNPQQYESITNNVESNDNDEAVRAQSSAASLKILLPAVSIGIFLSAADQTIIVASYGIIGSELNALNLTSFIATAYFLTLTSFQPLYGKLSDIFGRKLCLLWAYLIFGLGGLFCGLAQNIYQLIAARVFQGIGGGGMTTMVSIILNDVVPLKDRGIWQGVANIIYSAGAASGAPLGGILSDCVSWRFAFLIQVPSCVVAFLTVWLFVELPQSNNRGSPRQDGSNETNDSQPTNLNADSTPDHHSQHWQNSLRRVDFPGAFTLVLAVTSLIFGLDRGSNETWTSPISYIPVSIALLVLFPIFVTIEHKASRETDVKNGPHSNRGNHESAHSPTETTKIKREPFAPPHLILSRSLLPAYLCNFFTCASWLACLYYLPFYYQAVLSTNATQSSLRLLPAVIAGVSGSLTSGFTIRRTGKYYVLTLTAFLLVLVGYIPIIFFSGIMYKSWQLVTLGTLFCSFGNGMGITSTLIALIASCDAKDTAVVTACSYLFRSLGSVIGISLSATAIQTSLRVQLVKRLKGADGDAEEIARGVRRSLKYLDTLDEATVRVVRLAYEYACRVGFLVMICLAGLTVLSALFIKEKRIS